MAVRKKALSFGVVVIGAGVLRKRLTATGASGFCPPPPIPSGKLAAANRDAALPSQAGYLPVHLPQGKSGHASHRASSPAPEKAYQFLRADRGWAGHPLRRRDVLSSASSRSGRDRAEHETAAKVRQLITLLTHPAASLDVHPGLLAGRV